MANKVVPAQPGWFILRVIQVGDEYKYQTKTTPIVAWRVDVNEHETPWAYPVTVLSGEMFEVTEDTLLLTPEGKVISPIGGATWDTVEDCIRDLTHH